MNLKEVRTMKNNKISANYTAKVSEGLTAAMPHAARGLLTMAQDIASKEFWRENRKKKICLAIVAAIVTAIVIFLEIPAFAGGGGLTGGATEMTQIANNSELAGIYGQTAQQVSNGIQQINNQMQMLMNQAQQYAEMLKQGLTMPVGIANDIFDQVQDLYDTSVAADGLFSAYGNSESWLNAMRDRSGVLSSMQLAERQNEEKTETNEAIAGRIDNIVRQQNEQAAKIAQLQNMNRSAVGQMQAAQVGNDTMAVMAQELVKMRADMATYQLAEIQKEQEKLERQKQELTLIEQQKQHRERYRDNW